MSAPLLRKTGRPLRTCVLAISAALTCGAVPVSLAQNSNGLVFNYQYPNGPYGAHSYLIATLPASSANTYDHLHLLVTTNLHQDGGNNSYMDLTFANRNGFSYTYTLRGTVVNPTANVLAYAQSDGSVNIYLYEASDYIVGGYTVLENVQENVYTQPSDSGGSMPGTLLFNAASTPPTTFVSRNGLFGVGTPFPQNGMSVNTGMNVDQANIDNGTNAFSSSSSTLGISFGSGSGEGISSARTQGAPNQYGLDFYTGFAKRMSVTSNGFVGIGTAAPSSALTVAGDVALSGSLRFADGSTMSSASNAGGAGAGGTTSTQLGVGTSSPGTWSGIQNVGGSNIQVLGNGTNARVIINSTVNDAAELHLVDGAAAVNQHNHRWYADNNGLVLDQPTDNYSATTLNMFWANNGFVGINTKTPSAQLEVDGNFALSGNLTLTAGSGASVTFPDNTVQSTAWNGVLAGGDYAESVDVSGMREEYQPGDVLVIDSSSEGHFLKSSSPYSTAVTGIYATKPGVIGRRQLSAREHMKQEVPMAMIGVVPTKVSAENGPIKPGDLLVTSSRPGYAMKGTDRTQMLGAVLGKAIGHLDTGVGVIEAAVTLQ